MQPSITCHFKSTDLSLDDEQVHELVDGHFLERGLLRDELDDAAGCQQRERKGGDVLGTVLRGEVRGDVSEELGLEEGPSRIGAKRSISSARYLSSLVA